MEIFTFCSRYLWFPSNSTWNKFQVNSTDNYPNNQSLLVIFPLIIILICIRWILKRYFFQPIGQWFGLIKPKTVPKNAILERAYIDQIIYNQRQILDLARKLKCSVPEICEWLYYRSLQDKPCVLDIFCEDCWRYVSTTCFFIYGFIVLRNKPWFNNIKLCYINLSDHMVTNDIWWYYMLNFAYYWLLYCTIFLLKEPRSTLSFIKQTITVILLHISWTINFVRITSVLIFIFSCYDQHGYLDELATHTENYQILFIQMYLFTIISYYTNYIIWNMSPIYKTLWDILIELGWSFKTLLMSILILNVYCSLILLTFIAIVKILIYSWTSQQDENNFDSSCSRSNTVSEGTKVAGSKVLLTFFKWEGGGGQVYINGTFTGWEILPMVKSHGDFITIIDLSEDEHQYKFYVDGEWRHDPGLIIVDNGVDSKNNLVL